MNKQELIGKYEYLNHNFFRRVDTSEVLKDLKQLDEPEKVKVSEEEAKFLKTFDFNCKSDVTAALYNISRTGYGYLLTDNNGTELKGLSEKFRNIENRKRLIRAILFGYEVEKEKRYRVKIKGEIEENCLVYGLGIKRYFFTSVYDSSKRNEHTRKQLEEADFGWVFDCEGIEVEEVKE